MTGEAGRPSPPPPPLARAAGAGHLQRGHRDVCKPTSDNNSLGPDVVPNMWLQAAAEANRALLSPQPEAKSVPAAWTPQPKASYIGAAILVSHDSRYPHLVTRKRPRRLPSEREKDCGEARDAGGTVERPPPRTNR
ncbi:hypothetical protein HJG60_011972 [Phyllostomus discolor]|uniref:Uncharacterized protein n=1 Tax=Phyllostomus discolor TaxID=89673 RepID=A0A833ZPS8_9CHIR|nr:hypothetical protein HJG60_011972 [Phyllostomus discolor]